jgi:hypothetical protein
MKLKHLRGFELNESVKGSGTGFILKVEGANIHGDATCMYYLGTGMNYFQFMDRVKEELGLDVGDMPSDEVDVNFINPEDILGVDEDFYVNDYPLWVAESKGSKEEFEFFSAFDTSPYDMVETLDSLFTNAKSLMSNLSGNAKDGNFLVSWVLEDPSERLEALDGYRDFKALLKLLAHEAKASGDKDFLALLNYYQKIKGLI